MNIPYIPLSLYIHLPWCIKKCPYCDFNSHQVPEQLPEKAYISALKTDLDQHVSEDTGFLGSRKIHSIFIGGGTPSLFSAEGIAQILEVVNEQIGFEPNAEITLEANPGASEQARFRGYREAGVNRLSIGIQSFQKEKLQGLGRVHNAEEAKKAVIIAKEAGFDNFNLDLMYGLPGQSVSDAMSDLETAIAFQPKHLSWYNLTLEPNTAFHRRPPQLPDDDTLGQIEHAGYALLNNFHYKRYEISAYSQAHAQSQHNLNYWQFGDYLGIGAGAHSKLSRRANDGTLEIIRFWKQRVPHHYMNLSSPFTSNESILSHQDKCFEFMLNGLRLLDGSDLNLFTTRTGLNPEHLSPAIEKAISKQLLIRDASLLKPTALGHRFLNDLVMMFHELTV